PKQAWRSLLANNATARQAHSIDRCQQFRRAKAEQRMKFIYALFYTLSVLHVVPSAATAQSSAIQPVHLRSPETGETGRGFFIRSNDGCVIVTTRHFAKNRDEFVYVDSSGRRDRASSFALSADQSIDAALLTPSSPPNNCPWALPQQDEANRLGAESGTLRIVSENGSIIYMRVDLRRHTVEGTVVLWPNDPREVTPEGASGAPLVVSGAIIGMQLGNQWVAEQNREVPIAIYLSNIVNHWPDELRAAGGLTTINTIGVTTNGNVVSTAPENSEAPYSSTQIPDQFAAVRQIVVAARNLQAIAERNARLASVEASLARDAGAAARSHGIGPWGRNQTFANFPAGLPSDKAGNAMAYFGDYYNYTGSGDYRNGYGISRILSGPLLGAEIFCAHRATGCVGAGEMRWVDWRAPGAVELTWRGALNGYAPAGAGVVQYPVGSDVEQIALSLSARDLSPTSDMTSAPSVWRLADGRQFQGESTLEGWQGNGTLWDATGRLTHVGTWRDGQLTSGWVLGEQGWLEVKRR
ncbi:MAG: hypothetical protein AAFW68_12855, partial [Pseudomonadota bacterium]